MPTDSRRTHRARQLTPLAVALSAGLLLSACSGLQTQADVNASESASRSAALGDAASSAATPDSDAASSSDAASGDSVATFTFDQGGAKVTTTIAAGEPSTDAQSPVDSQALDDCGWNYRSVLDTTVFIQGRLTITYDGTIGDQVGFNPQLAVRQLSTVGQLGAGDVGKVGIQGSDGSFHCGADGDRWSEHFEPGESKSVEWYAGLQVLSNAQPTLTADLKRALAIQWFAYGIPEVQFPDKPQAVASGPNAALCEAKGDDAPIPTQLLYIDAPATFGGQDVDGNSFTVQCDAP